MEVIVAIVAIVVVEVVKLCSSHSGGGGGGNDRITSTSVRGHSVSVHRIGRSCCFGSSISSISSSSLPSCYSSMPFCTYLWINHSALHSDL